MRNRYFEDEAEPEKFNGKMFRRIMSYVKPYKRRFIFVFCLMIAMGFVVLVPPFLNRIIMDDILGEMPVNAKSLAIGVIIGWAAVGISEVAYNFIRQRMLNATASSMIRDIRAGAFYHLQKLSFDYFDNRPAGKILVRVTSYINELANIFANTVINLFVDGIKIVLVLGWLYILDFRLAALITAVIVPMGAILILLHKALRKRHIAAQNKSSNRTAYIAENIQGTAVTKAFNRTAINVDTEKELTGKVTKAWERVVAVNELMWPTMDFFWSVGSMGIYTLAFILGTRVLGRPMTLGTVVSFTGYLSMFQLPLFNIGNYLQQIAMGSSRLERIFETLDTPPSVVDCESAYDMPEITGAIEFENVDFAYDKGINILENINLSVEAGKTVALVGPTGGGKTTVVNLISRFYDATGGRVLIDGHDVKSVKLHSLRPQIAVMMQDSFIFSGTVMDNIRYSRPDATDAECIDAAEKANCGEFIRALPGGYSHVLAERGSELSAGQLQLLSFARAVLADPRILILDEATSNVDTATEAAVQDVIEKLLVGRTSFIIAHRLSTIKKADCILYVSNRGIQEAGTHEQLMAKKGLYYKLATTR